MKDPEKLITEVLPEPMVELAPVILTKLQEEYAFVSKSQFRARLASLTDEEMEILRGILIWARSTPGPWTSMMDKLKPGED